MVAKTELETISELLDEVANLNELVKRLQQIVRTMLAIESGEFEDAKNCGKFENHDVHIWQDVDDYEYVCDGGW